MDFFGRTCGFQVILKFCHIEDSSFPKQYTMDVPEFSHFLITYISFDILILRANTEKCIINILLSNTLSKSDPINLFCTENYLPQTNNTASYYRTILE